MPDGPSPRCSRGCRPKVCAQRLCGFGTASLRPGVHNLDMTVRVADRLHLNAEQRTALNLMDEGPLRVIAGPGTGKTTTVVAMYLRLLEEVGLRPSQVLLLTFANNAASDLKRRIDALHNASYDEVVGQHLPLLRHPRPHHLRPPPRHRPLPPHERFRGEGADAPRPVADARS